MPKSRMKKTRKEQMERTKRMAQISQLKQPRPMCSALGCKREGTNYFNNTWYCTQHYLLEFLVVRVDEIVQHKPTGQAPTEFKEL